MELTISVCAAFTIFGKLISVGLRVHAVVPRKMSKCHLSVVFTILACVCASMHTCVMYENYPHINEGLCLTCRLVCLSPICKFWYIRSDVSRKGYQSNYTRAYNLKFLQRIKLRFCFNQVMRIQQNRPMFRGCRSRFRFYTSTPHGRCVL